MKLTQVISWQELGRLELDPRRSRCPAAQGANQDFGRNAEPSVESPDHRDGQAPLKSSTSELRERVRMTSSRSSRVSPCCSMRNIVASIGSGRSIGNGLLSQAPIYPTTPRLLTHRATSHPPSSPSAPCRLRLSSSHLRPECRLAAVGLGDPGAVIGMAFHAGDGSGGQGGGQGGEPVEMAGSMAIGR